MKAVQPAASLVAVASACFHAASYSAQCMRALCLKTRRLTIPSSGRLAGCAVKPPLMSNGRFLGVSCFTCVAAAARSRRPIHAVQAPQYLAEFLSGMPRSFACGFQGCCSLGGTPSWVRNSAVGSWRAERLVLRPPPRNLPGQSSGQPTASPSSAAYFYVRRHETNSYSCHCNCLIHRARRLQPRIPHYRVGFNSNLHGRCAGPTSSAYSNSSSLTICLARGTPFRLVSQRCHLRSTHADLSPPQQWRKLLARSLASPTSSLWVIRSVHAGTHRSRSK
jgi:hypothetical protein